MYNVNYIIEYFCIRSITLNNNDNSLQIIISNKWFIVEKKQKETELSVRIQFVDFSFVSF